MKQRPEACLTNHYHSRYHRANRADKREYSMGQFGILAVALGGVLGILWKNSAKI